ncbi:MAG: peptidylprolyl isomerase [Proteobacteria bacterium]|nr:peptidylprolyl isomerase [Pseudomonadota bacterium]
MKHKKIRTRRHADFVMPVVACATVLFAIFAFTELAFAQRIQRIAATVNEDIVSEYDLQARMQVVVVSSGLRPTPQLRKRLSQQVLRSLIDEQLRLQEAKKRNVRVSEGDMRSRIAMLEKQNRIPAGTLDDFLKKIGIPREALMKQIRAQITWQKLVRRTILPRVTVGEDEIDETLQRLRERKGQVEYRVSEILLTVDQPQREGEIRRTAERLLEELGKGAKFDAIARQFSQTASASVGGDLGWIQEATMNSELRQIVSRMKEGETAGPVRTLAGMQIFRLTKRRKILSASSNDTIVDLQQILLPLRKEFTNDDIKAQLNLAQTLSDTISDCNDHLRAAGEAKSIGGAKLGKVRLGNLSKTIRGAIENLPVGKASPPIRTKESVAIFMVCNRKEAESSLPSREQIADRMRAERVDVLARRYLRDLRAAAIVDLRV